SASLSVCLLSACAEVQLWRLRENSFVLRLWTHECTTEVGRPLCRKCLPILVRSVERSSGSVRTDFRRCYAGHGRCPIRAETIRPCSGFHSDGCLDAGTRNRRDHGDIHALSCRVAEVVAG